MGIKQESKMEEEIKDVDIQPSEKPFRVFATQKEFDDFASSLIRKGSEKALKDAKVDDNGVMLDKKEYEKKYRKDLEVTIRAEIERQSKLTEQERLDEQRRIMQEEFRVERTELNKDLARAMLTKAGFDEDEMEVYLDFVTDDKDISLGKIRRVCENRTTSQEKLKEQWLQELQKSNPSVNIGSKEADDIQSRYRQALKNGNLGLASSILREAQSKGIVLTN